MIDVDPQFQGLPCVTDVDPETGTAYGMPTYRVSAVTREPIRIPAWTTEIDPEDREWFERQWTAEDEFDRKLREAGIAP